MRVDISSPHFTVYQSFTNSKFVRVAHAFIEDLLGPCDKEYIPPGKANLSNLPRRNGNEHH